MPRSPIIPIRADEEAKARWQAAADADSTSLSEFVRAAVEEKIERGVKPISLVTKSGRVLTEEDIQKLADEAERGYDPADITPKFTPEFSPSNPAIQGGSATTTSAGGKVFKGMDPKGGRK